MEQFINRISNFTYNIKNTLSYDEWDEIGEDFQMWLDSRNKHDVERYFYEFNFGVYYANRLYRSRALCFYEVLKNVAEFSGVTNILKQSTNVISFGCGPGPEIAAYVGFIREELNSPNIYLNITAVDQLEYWNQFIYAVSDVDENTNLTFVNAKFNLQYVRSLSRSDVCLMSYPHAVNFDDIWVLLKRKFSLIVVIDQSKSVLLNKVKRCGYNLVNFEFKGHKTFFFYLDPNILIDDDDDYSDDEDDEDDDDEWGFENYDYFDQYAYEDTDDFVQNFSPFMEEDYCPRVLKCKRGLHEKSYEFSACFESIQHELSCGHFVTMKCYQNEKPMSCTKMIVKTCPRNIHRKEMECCQLFKCDENIRKMLFCGHSVVIKCFQAESSDAQCRKLVEYKLKCGHIKLLYCFQTKNVECLDLKCDQTVVEKCKRNIHAKSVPCGEIYKCLEMVTSQLNCGHSFSFHCYQNESALTITTKCTKVVTRYCRRNAHQYEIMCFKTLITCNKTFPKRLKGGHVVEVQCDGLECNYGDHCKKIVPIKCKNGIHSKEIECGSSFICTENINFKLYCGHEQNYLCNDLDYKNRLLIKCFSVKECKHKCFISCFCDLFKHESLGMHQDDMDFESMNQLCTHIDDKNCNNLCNKLMKCKHLCQRKCDQCFKGRMHGKCLEKCDKILDCGHKCKEKCHRDSCIECSENCFRTKLKAFSLMNLLNFSRIKKQWSHCKSLVSCEADSRVVNYLNDVIKHLTDRKNSKPWLDVFQFSVEYVKSIITLYGMIIRDTTIDESLFDYTSYIKSALLLLLEWANPIDRNLSISLNKEFLIEFRRLREMYHICVLSSKSNKKGLLELVHKYGILLKELKECPQNSVINKINEI